MRMFSDSSLSFNSLLIFPSTSVSSSTLKLASADDFYKYEILESSNHELVHGEANRGKICDIDKSKLEEGTYTLKVYTDDFVITSDITISGGEQNLNGIVQ